MNKYLLMSAAAALATSAGGGVARAATTLYLATVECCYCDYFVVTRNGGHLYAAKHVGALNCGSSVFNDPAYLGGKSTSPFGTKTKSVGFADTVFAAAGSIYDGLEFVFSYPFNPDAGGVWAILANTTGNTTYVLNNGWTTNKIRLGRHESSVAHAMAALKQ